MFVPLIQHKLLADKKPLLCDIVFAAVSGEYRYGKSMNFFFFCFYYSNIVLFKIDIVL